MERIAQCVLGLVCGTVPVSRVPVMVSPLVLRVMLATAAAIADSKGTCVLVCAV